MNIEYSKIKTNDKAKDNAENEGEGQCVEVSIIFQVLIQSIYMIHTYHQHSV